MTARKTAMRRCDAGHEWDAKSEREANLHAKLHEDGFTHEPVEGEEEKGRPPSGAKVLLDLFARDRATVIRDQFGEGYAKFVGGRVLHLSRSGVGAALTNLYMQYEEGSPPPKGSIDEVVEVLKARVEEAKREPVYLRFGPLPDDGGFAIDRGDPGYTAIVIRPGRWTIEDHPINFRRAKGIGQLPEPFRDPDEENPAGHALSESLRAILNITKDDEARLVAAFLVSIMKPNGSFLGLGLTGPAGAAKTFAARILRRILDPVSQEGGGGVKSLPRSQDAFSAIVTAHAIPVFDNLSTANSEQSDWLAQVMTGYSDEKRTLYSDTGSTERSARAPVILTGIDITDRSDLMSRLLIVELSPMPSYTTEELVWERFEAYHPILLGALCDVVAAAYERLPGIKREGYTVRMADMVRFVTAAEPALGWPEGWTERHLAESQGNAVAVILEQQSWYEPLRALLTSHGGSAVMTPTSMLDELRSRYVSMRRSGDLQGDDRTYEPKATDTSWPKNAKGLTDALIRQAPGLASVGITVSKGRSNGRNLLTVALDAEATIPEG